MWCWYVKRASGLGGVIGVSLIEKIYDKKRNGLFGYGRTNMKFKNVKHICVRMYIYLFIYIYIFLHMCWCVCVCVCLCVWL